MVGDLDVHLGEQGRAEHDLLIRTDAGTAQEERATDVVQGRAVQVCTAVNRASWKLAPVRSQPITPQSAPVNS